jgi:hypothetical protein
MPRSRVSKSQSHSASKREKTPHHKKRLTSKTSKRKFGTINPEADKNLGRMILRSDNYKEIQSSIEKRRSIANLVVTQLRETFVPGTPCDTQWKYLFSTSSFDSSPQLGKGNYGAARLISLKNIPGLNLAIKRTRKMEFDEVYYSLLAGSLPEVGANPHFNMFYMHLHCEEGGTALYKTLKHKLIDWKDANSKIVALSKKPQTEDIKRQIIEIERLAYPSLDDIRFFHGYKLQREQEFHRLYGHLDRKEYPSDVRELMKQFNSTYRIMQEVRSKYHKPYEYLLMELAESGNSFQSFIHSAPPAKELISVSFQVCMAAISLVAFFGIVQNDLLMSNITYNQVNPDVYYVYKIGRIYIKVPLYGKLVKIFDFGLTTDTDTFYKPTLPDQLPTHWCVGGRGVGSEDKLACSAFVRDILEYFTRLDDEYGCKYPNICKTNLNDDILDWIDYSRQLAQNVTFDSIPSAIGLIFNIFSPVTLSKFHLPAVVDISETPFPLMPTYQASPFEVINKKKYIQSVHQIIDRKIWQI